MPTRQELLNSLLAGESHYITALNAIQTELIDGLAATKTASSSEIASMFRTLPSMKRLHDEMNKQLAMVKHEDSLDHSVASAAQVILRNGAELREHYIAYIKGHETAMHIHSKCMTRPQYAQYLERTFDAAGTLQGASMAEVLALPMRHLIEYIEIIGRLAKVSPGINNPSHDEDSEMRSLHLTVLEARELLHDIRMGSGGLPNGFLHRLKPIPTLYAPMYVALSNTNENRDRSKTTDTIQTVESSKTTDTLKMNNSVSPSKNATPSGHDGTKSVNEDELDLANDDVTVEEVEQARRQAVQAEQQLDELYRAVERTEAEIGVAKTHASALRPLDRSAGGVEEGETTDDELDDDTHAWRETLQELGLERISQEALEEAMRRLEIEEKSLYEEIHGSEHRAMFEAFLAKKQELQHEEEKLSKAIEEHEETLAQVRQRLANPPQSLLPSDPTKAALYIAWKRALAEREDLLRQARRRKHNLMRTLSARHEAQVLALDSERRKHLGELESEIEKEREKAKAYKEELDSLDASIKSAREAMGKFRQQFEQLRVALLIDRMAKGTQVANLTERRRRLNEEAEEFKSEVEAARERIAAEESAKWEAKIEEARREGDKKIAEEKKRIEEKVQSVRETLTKKYEEGFQPLLEEAERRQQDEAERLKALEAEFAKKQQELHEATEEAKSLATEMNPTQLKHLEKISQGEQLDEDEIDDEYDSESEKDMVPEWKLKEFEDLKETVATLWEELDIPEEEIVEFLSEAEMAAPYHPTILKLYREMHSQLMDAVEGGADKKQPAISEPLDASSYSNSNGSSFYTDNGTANGKMSTLSASHTNTNTQALSPQNNIDTYSSSVGKSSPQSAFNSTPKRERNITAFERAMREQMALRTFSALSPSFGGAGGTKPIASPSSATRTRQKKQAPPKQTSRLKW